MKTIYKYPLEITAVQTVMLPLQARLLTIQMQGGRIFLWAAVDTSKDVYPVTIDMYGTGWSDVEVSEKEHIDTIQVDGFVWHFFVR